MSIKIYEMCVNKVRCKEKIQHIHTCVRHEYKHVIYAEICVQNHIEMCAKIQTYNV